jgi:hypothetical protein
MTTIYDEIVQLKNCALELFVGNLLGDGSYRRVYDMRHEPEHVLKIQYGPGHHNAMEWEIWQAVKGTKWERWFAPCVRIDSWGSALIMKKATVFENEPDFLEKVKRVPTFFDDVRWTNWGMIDGRPVCIDYGYTHLLRAGLWGTTPGLKRTHRYGRS